MEPKTLDTDPQWLTWYRLVQRELRTRMAPLPVPTMKQFMVERLYYLWGDGREVGEASDEMMDFIGDMVD